MRKVLARAFLRVTGWAPGDHGAQRTHNFSIEVQHSLGFSTVVSAAYVGNRQRGLSTTRNLNLVPVGARFDAANVDPTSASRGPLQDAFLRPIPQFANVTERSREGYEASLRAAGFKPITTEIADAPEFYYAEDYHQQYLAANPNGYCGLGGTGVRCG